MASVATRPVTDTQGMNYLVSLPRRIVTIWLPLTVFLIVLLFPFYWMVMTTFKPNEELLQRSGNPFWVHHPTFAHIHKLLFETDYPQRLWNTVLVTVVSTLRTALFQVPKMALGLWARPPYCQSPARLLASALMSVMNRAGHIGRCATSRPRASDCATSRASRRSTAPRRSPARSAARCS